MEPNNSEFIDTTIILNGTTYSFSPSLQINGGKSIEVQQLKFDRLANADLITENGILLEANNRGYFYVPMKDSAQLVNNNLLTADDIALNQSEHENVCQEESSSFNLSLEAPQEQCTSATKRKGGWPKGKKRKKQVEASKAPKAPTTGYVRFLNERRQIYKELHPELPFAEVTRILGSEWSNMPSEEKKKYLNEAEADKKRYREELKTYLQSEEYQIHLKRKKLNNICKINSEFQDEINSLDIDDEDSEELYCKICDQFFNSLHNKREHLYGKHHLQMVTGNDEKNTLNSQESEDVLGVDNDLLSGVLTCEQNSFTNQLKGTVALPSPSEPVNVPQIIDNLLTATFERENEIQSLKTNLERLRQTSDNFNKQLVTMRELKKTMEIELMQLKIAFVKWNEQIESLKMIPTLFHVINF
uniref:HMG box domain-containing protein n=1 Tax=Strigamia maritima TaxID=126957 RepID=T1IIT7_STRMM